MGYHDTFARVFAALGEEFKDSFLSWVSSITERLGIELIHIDGKTKGSLDREENSKRCIVSAPRSEHQLVLAQQKVDGKSNEITAVPLLLKLLNLKGAVVTLDAMRGTRRRWQIQQAEGTMCLLSKKPRKLSQQVENWFKQAEAKNWQGEYSYHQTVDGTSPGETRQVWAVSVRQLPPLHRQSQWVGLTSVILVKSIRQLWNKTTEVRFSVVWRRMPSDTTG